MTRRCRHAWPAQPDDATPRFFAAVRLADSDAKASIQNGMDSAVERRFRQLTADAMETAVALPTNQSQECVEPDVLRNKHGQILCAPHGRRLYFCVECGGAGICVHKRRKEKCPQCKAIGKGKVGAGQGSGSSGGRAGGGDVLGSVRMQGMGISKSCGKGGDLRLATVAADGAVRRNKHGQILCAPHGRVLYRCVECGGAGICVHKRRKSDCSTCKLFGR